MPLPCLRQINMGESICQVLRGVWRQVPPSHSPELLQNVVPVLQNCGMGGLCWRLLQNSPLANTVLGRRCYKQYRQGLMEAAAWEQHARKVVGYLRQHGIEPIIIKGLATARAYALPYSRPWGDIDLGILPEQFPKACTLLASDPMSGQHVDLHCGVPDLQGRSNEEIWERSYLIPSTQTQLRLPASEDHFRLLCLHAVRHCLERPLYLCDIAATLEALPPGFDWDLCLRGKRRFADWILCMTGLAQNLLGAKVADTAIASGANRYPAWLERLVLRTWSEKFPAPVQNHSLLSQVRNLRLFNPIRTAYRVGISPHHSLWTLGLASALSRPWQGLVRLHRLLAGLRQKPALPFSVHAQRIY